MSQPSGASPPPGASRQPVSPGNDSPSLVARLPLVAAGAGLLAYLLAFFTAQSAAAFVGIPGFCLITAAALAGMRFLPKAPNTLYAAGPLAAAGALVLLQVVLRGGAGAMLIVIMIVALIQLGAVTGALLWEAGVVGTPSAGRPRPMPPPSNPSHFRPPPGGWSPPSGGPGQPGPFPPPGGRPQGGPGPGPAQQPQFPPSGPQQQGGRNPGPPGGRQGGQPGGQQGGGATQQIPPPTSGQTGPPPGGIAGTLSPPSGQPVTPPPSGGSKAPPPSGAQGGTQQLPFPPDES